MRKPILKNNIYHVYLRGIDKKDIFRDESDYQRFLKLLKYCNRKDSIHFSTLMRKEKKDILKILNAIIEDLGKIIIATLMPNHFHILIKCINNGSISKYMQKVLGSYALYFNKKYKKQGYKFENKFQYRRIENDYDLQNTIDYIYHNPTKLLDREYTHIDLLNKKYKLSRQQKTLIKNYPYTYKGPTFAKYKKRFNLYF